MFSLNKQNLLAFLGLLLVGPGLATSLATARAEERLTAASAGEEVVRQAPRLPPPQGAQAMPAPDRVWIDKKKGVVIVDGSISLREGMLEMFACPRGTKEHESVVAVHSRAQVVHAALLAVGAKTGKPVQWNPEFQPPTGTEIGITVHWQYTDGEWQKLSAQQWIKDSRTGEKMPHPWVFAGSGFWKDEATGEEYYMGESGDFICVSNFTTATLDIPTESSQVNDGLLFEANTPMIPPLGTPVRLVLKPKLGKQKSEVEIPVSKSN
ncbi:MAG: YdjY domain-containing protein [Pirellulales bacterium]|nr:YdjY domain-containing protein [Pirellulales bacterium]